MKNQLTLLIALLFSSILLLAQAPEGINYQTVVRDASGNILASQTIGAQFVLHQGTPTGTAVYTETWSKTTNAYGIIDFVLGTGTTTDENDPILDDE